MTKDPNDAYNHFAHLNKFLKKTKIIEINNMMMKKMNYFLSHQRRIFIKSVSQVLKKRVNFNI